MLGNRGLFAIVGAACGLRPEGSVVEVGEGGGLVGP